MSTIEGAPSAETEFKSARPVEAVPTTDEIDSIVNGPEAAVEQPATPQSRIANLLHKGADVLENAANNRQAKVEQDFAYDSYAGNIDATKSRERQERSQNRQEKREAVVDNVKDTLRGFGRSALRLPGFARRAYLETRAQVGIGVENAVALGQNVAGKAAEGIGTAAGVVAEKALDAQDAVVKGANVVRDTVADKAGEVKEAVTGKYESLKAGAEETMRKIEEAANRFETKADAFANKVGGSIDDAANALAGKYNRAREAVTGFGTEKMNQVKEYFAARKEAALSRKQARTDARNEKEQARNDSRVEKDRLFMEKLEAREAARDQRVADRAKTAEINDRVVNVRKMEIRDQQEARRADSLEAREARRQEAKQKAEDRRRGRAALKTAIRSGIYTAKETYNTLK